ncbi:unnamed protein product [Parnassius apollo]|uniref:(apollo) hypothetical protein n=1 Tax=Parnassius apollo TaxID=110799 RepID=A0A8S3WGT7_PARAO|nr:unnamed protein product [Parnassius apollo]
MKDIKGELASLRHDQTNLKQKLHLIENKHDNLQRDVLEIQNALDFNCDMNDKLGQRVEKLETDCVKNKKPSKSYLLLSRTSKLWSSMLGAVTLRYVVSQKKRNEYLMELVANFGIPKLVFMNEHLTLEKKKLFRDCRETAKKENYQYVWIKHATILVRESNNHAAIAIRTRGYISKIKACSSVEGSDQFSIDKVEGHILS